MSRINRVPRGLQDLLGSTNQGDNPSELLGDVRAGFDIFPFWGAERLKAITNFTANLSAATTLDHAVPEGRVWLPVAMSTEVTNPGFPALEVSIIHELLNINSDAGGTNIIPIDGWDKRVFTGQPFSMTFATQFPQQFLVSGGSIFRSACLYALNTGVTATMKHSILYYEFIA